jgi:proteic killer suppression protein
MTAGLAADGSAQRESSAVKRSLTFAFRRLTFLALIRSFRNRSLERYFEAGDPSGLSVPNVARVGRMLRARHATRPEQVNLPGFYWHPLQGEARWAIRVTGIGGSPSRGMALMPSLSIWRITIDDRAEDRNRVAGDASGRVAARGNIARARSAPR